MSLSSPLIPANPNILTNGTPADATQVMANFNNLVNNINSLLNASTGAGYVGVTADTRWGGGTSLQDVVGLLKDQQQLSDTGAVNALVVTPAGSLITANVSGMFFLVVPGHTTTSTTPTLQVGTAPALTIVNADGSAHFAGAIQASRPALFWYDTANSKAVHLNPLRTTLSFTGTGVGWAATVPTATINSVVLPDGFTVYTYLPQFTGTSNATTTSITGMPASIQPATGFARENYVVDSGAVSAGSLSIAAGTNTILFGKGQNYASGGFTATGSKTVGASATTSLQLSWQRSP